MPLQGAFPNALADAILRDRRSSYWPKHWSSTTPAEQPLPPQTFPEELIQQLACSREDEFGGQLATPPPSKPSTIYSVSSCESYSLLNELPYEILWMTLDLLDFWSLYSLSRVSLWHKAMVESHPKSRDIMEHAPTMLPALVRTRMLECHSVGFLHKSLRTSRCTSCRNFGAFVFLPTCERACFHCLHSNVDFWMMPLSKAKRYTGAKKEQLRALPRCHIVPGAAEIVAFQRWDHLQPRSLVSVKQAKELGVKLAGSTENLERHLQRPEVMSRVTHSWLDENVYRYFRNIITAQHPSTRWVGQLAGNEGGDYGYVASVRFPYLNEGKADHGRACRGCEFRCQQLQHRLLQLSELPEAISLANGSGFAPSRVLFVLAAARLRSRKEFSEHVKQCSGVRQLLFGGNEDQISTVLSPSISL
ncbi:hypothetical protein F4808DRAFT_399905 [Astrocystis sublimbata]|nr:hypothetical protein F4808DRAFT_399905 [Astrocystis sublimbata]